MGHERLMLWFSILLAVTGLALAGLYPVGNQDTFGHLAAGRQISELGWVPEVDSFSFFRETPQPWHNYEWLSDLVFWGAYSAFDYHGLLALKLFLLVLLAFFLVRRAWSSSGASGALWCSALLIFAIPAARFRLSVRPHLFGMVFGAFFLLGLPSVASDEQGARADRLAWRWIGLLAAAHLAWVNLHGSNLLGLALTAIYLAAYFRRRTARKRLLALLALQLVASCVSPYGPAILLDAIAHVADPNYREVVDEWVAWNAEHHPLWLLLAPLAQTALLVVAAPLLRRRGPAGWAALGVAALLALMAFRSIRFVADYMLLSSALLAEAAALVSAGWPARRRNAIMLALIASACAVATVASAALPPRVPLRWAQSTRMLPAGSASWLRDHLPEARILAAVEDSWYLTFALPRARFLIDGRIPFYGHEHVRLVVSAFRSPRLLRELLDRFDVDCAIVQHPFKGHQPMLATLRGLKGWSLVMIEDRHALFIRDIPGREALLEASRLTALAPAYEAAFALDPGADPARLRRELGRISGRPNTEGYRGWVGALLGLRPLTRDGDRAGIRNPGTEGERAAVGSALQRLRALSSEVTEVPTVDLYHAMAAAALCHLDEARQALELARAEGGSREALLMAQEIALREGDTGSVNAFLRQARALPGAEGDPWLAALSDMLRSAPRCDRGAGSPPD